MAVGKLLNPLNWLPRRSDDEGVNKTELRATPQQVETFIADALSNEENMRYVRKLIDEHPVRSL